MCCEGISIRKRCRPCRNQYHKEQYQKTKHLDYRRYNPEKYERDTWRIRLRQKLIEKLGSKCIQCGFSDTRALQIDHINNDAWKFRRKKDKYADKTSARYTFWRENLQGIRNDAQVLCANCHAIKTHEHHKVKVKARFVDQNA